MGVLLPLVGGWLLARCFRCRASYISHYTTEILLAVKEESQGYRAWLEVLLTAFTSNSTCVLFFLTFISNDSVRILLQEVRLCSILQLCQCSSSQTCIQNISSVVLIKIQSNTYTLVVVVRNGLANDSRND